jgi:hypothetical protein
MLRDGELGHRASDGDTWSAAILTPLPRSREWARSKRIQRWLEVPAAQPGPELAAAAEAVATVGAQAPDVAPEAAPVQTKATGAKKPTGEPRPQGTRWQ